MFIVDDKCFIHFPKCAGTSVYEDLVKQRRRDIRSIRFHASAKTVPAHFDDFEKIALIRNPLTWYDSYLSFERERLRKGKFIFFPVNFILLKNYPNPEFCSPEESMERALNFKEYFSANPRYMEVFRDMLIDYTSPQLFTNVYYDNQETFSENLADTLFQEFYRIYGLNDVSKYKLENGVDEVYEILGIREGMKSNVSTIKYFSGFEQQISKSDHKIITELGYE